MKIAQILIILLITSTITLDQNYGVRNAYFIGTGDTPTYSCVDVENTKTKNKNPLPIANFVSVDRVIRFMKDSLENRKNQILQTQNFFIRKKRKKYNSRIFQRNFTIK